MHFEENFALLPEKFRKTLLREERKTESLKKKKSNGQKVEKGQNVK